MTAIVIGHNALEACPDIFGVSHFEKEIRKFPHPLPETMRLFQRARIVLEEIGKMMRDHGRARTGWHDDVFGCSEHIQKMPGDLPGLLAISAVECRLATARLRLR